MAWSSMDYVQLGTNPTNKKMLMRSIYDQIDVMICSIHIVSNLTPLCVLFEIICMECIIFLEQF